MNDGRIKNDGTSRLMRSMLPATYEEFRQACANGTQPLDIMFNALGWEVLPTFLNVANLLKQQTGALFGLGTNAVPDDVLAYVGKYAQYWWRRRLLNAGTEYITPYIEGSSSSEDPAKYILYVYDSDAPGSITYPIQYSDGVTVGDDGKPTGLADPIKTVNLSYDNCLTEGNVLKGKFIVQRYEDKRFPSRSADKGIAFVPSTAVFDRVTKYGTESYVYTDYISIDITANPKKGDWEYLQSNDDDAYPHSGESGGYEYEYLGVPFENAATAPKISTGSYFGTETSRTISVSFNSPITAFIICALDKVVVSGSIRDWSIGIYLRGSKKMASLKSGDIRDLDVSISGDGKTISWSGSSNYSDLPFTFNANGTYLYMAIHG